MKSDNLSDMQKAVEQFIEKRGWKKYHTPKNSAMDLVREASETLEHFIWPENEIIKKDKKRIKMIGEEMGDTLHALLSLSSILGIDLSVAFWKKLEAVKKKYPIGKVKDKLNYGYKKK